MPAAQSEQLVAPALLLFPPSQSTQLDWPVVCWYLPEAQSSHSVSPAAFVICPAAQFVQLVAPVWSPYLPTSHLLQFWYPTSAYVPFKQKSHPVPSPVGTVPAVHDKQLVAPSLLYMPSSQSKHEVCPVAGWYCPDAHALQFFMPVRSDTKPAAQAVQEDAPAMPL